ncbi:hypothetical protein ACFW9F_16765 [Streptomyces sp. NPDC059506]|uniref:hypothetical protein n=1 Tax=Streptomyces sp. NPDC059506 TaxID=3347751 RepID=UPI00369245CD
MGGKKGRGSAADGGAGRGGKGRRNCFAGGRFWDREGRPWRRSTEWLDPERAHALIREGALWAVEWCGGCFEWPGETGETGERVLEEEILPRMIDRAEARRLMRRRSVPTVQVAERWVGAAGQVLVLFHESGPAPRTEDWFR